MWGGIGGWGTEKVLRDRGPNLGESRDSRKARPSKDPKWRVREKQQDSTLMSGNTAPSLAG